MTSNKEDYLKAIYEAGGLERFVPNKKIAESLNIAAPSVSEMLIKLSQAGLIEYEAYHGSRLTQKGMDSCMKVVRSHRLWEVFLRTCLHYDWEEAHEDAHLLEHISPERIIDRLDAFLQYPATCPHGAPIPREGEAPSLPDNLIPLAALSEGEAAVLSLIPEEKEVLICLEKTGLVVGKSLKLLSADGETGEVTFEQGDGPITVSREAAALILVEREQPALEEEE